MTSNSHTSGQATTPKDDTRSEYLFSIDLEDIRTQTKSGLNHVFRVPAMVEHLLRFFDDHKIKSTFFVVGQTAKEIGTLIREIHETGHEIGCHTYDHTQLDKMNPETFRENLLRNLEVLSSFGVDTVYGFRAPDFSLIESTKWAWEVLRELGFKYSSSVLPARNPLYGWRDFHPYPKRLDNGLWELPISITSIFGIKIPFTGGVYLRFFPKSVLLPFCRKHVKTQTPLVGYLHPYDIDNQEEKFKVDNNPFFNWLVYYNRKSTLPKLEFLMRKFILIKFLDYVDILEKSSLTDKDR